MQKNWFVLNRDKNESNLRRMAEEPTLRIMWVWNDNVENKEKIKVAYVFNNGCTYWVLSIVDEEKLERVKEKYKNGVTTDILKEFI